jgi:pilus assembly protein CpaE
VYPLDVVLIGCGDDVAPHLRLELLNNGATPEFEFQDVSQALEALRSSKDKRRLVILRLEPFETFEDLGRLCHALPNCSIVALMDSSGDDRIQLNSSFLSVMRLGASQIVGLPLNPQDFKTALKRIGEKTVIWAKDRSQVFAVAGVTGGCGATSLAINLGQEIAHLWKKRCILADLSRKLGAASSHLNVEPTRSINDLLCHKRRLDESLIREVLVRIDENYDLLPGPDRLVAGQAYSSADVLQLMDRLKPFCDVLVLDLPCTYDDFYFEVLKAADHVVLVGEPKVPSIRALKLVHQMVGRSRPDETQHVVINRFDENAGSLCSALLARILESARFHTIPQELCAFSDTENRGCTLRQSALHSAALAEIGTLARHLVEGNGSNKETIPHASLTKRLIHASV